MKSKTAYRFGTGLGITSSLFLLMLIGAVGVIGAEGDRFDLVYFGVVAIGVVGSLIARFNPDGMSYALFAMALAQALVVVVALLIGKQDSPVSSVFEIVGAERAVHPAVHGLGVAVPVGGSRCYDSGAVTGLLEPAPRSRYRPRGLFSRFVA